MQITTKRVDYNDARDSEELIRLLSEYALLEDGDDAPDLSRLPEMLAEFPTALSLLAYVDSRAVGLVNCFFGFSTFYLRRLINIHDVIVTKEMRGNGISGALLAAVEKIAIENDCCRMTLEVHADNLPAMRAYDKHGFTRDPTHPDTDSLFLRKSLVESE